MTRGSAVIATLALIGGYAALVGGLDAMAPVLLVTAYLVLVPWAIMTAGRPRARVAVPRDRARSGAVDGRSRSR